jgi:hypothetical protein
MGSSDERIRAAPRRSGDIRLRGLKPLLEGEFDVIHCLERDVCNIIYRHRHLFRKPPKIVFSNGGAIPAKNLPLCDFVQEHTDHNLSHSARDKAFMIPTAWTSAFSDRRQI